MSFKSKLKRKQPLLGSWISLAHPAIPEIMAGCGFNFLVIDMEHSVIELDEAENLVRSIQGQGIPALVRVGEHNPNLIKRVMDTGATGIIAALVTTPEEAKAIVEAAKYPPQGTRGVGLARAQKYGQGFHSYKEWLKRESVVLVLIEHIRAIEDLEAILSVEGVDGSLIGPYDLSGSLGVPGEFDRPEVKKAIARYEEVCRRLRKPMGFHVVHPEAATVKKYIKKGYRILAVGVDTLYLAEKCKETMAKIRGRS